tara:strand:+ start:18 stop:1352 length:1335 start_codon:yes stop_codon:yes gene_type:complete
MKSFQQIFCKWASKKKLQKNKFAYFKAQNAFIDTLACILSGVKEKQSKIAIKSCLETSNFGNIKLFGGGKKLSITSASFVNGVRSAAIDFDDYESVGASHPSAPIYSALLSISQIKPIKLAEIYDSWIVGYEIIIRLGQSLGYSHYYKGWHSAITLGTIGTAAAVSRALKLNSDQISNAISIATSSSSGLKLQFGEDTKAFHIGLASQAGIQSALLAKYGGTANQNIWDDKRGFIEMYGTKSSKKLNLLIPKIKFGEASVKYPNFMKMWPTCSYTHRIIEAGILLNKKIKSKKDIKSIVIKFPEPWIRVSRFHIPKNTTEARFSLSYCFSVSLLNGYLDFKSLNLHQNKKAWNLTKKIKLITYNVPINYIDNDPKYYDTVHIILKNGDKYEQKVSKIKGGSLNPLSDEEIEQKYLMCGGKVNILNKIKKNKNKNKILNNLLFKV